ncbi:MAG TPA: ribosome maturation factor RimM [Candidatus Eremiobacteraceae bacterium]|nr:ribosome maturation factor RimM [Candidatus Eremiobacteraceae bacterium]
MPDDVIVGRVLGAFGVRGEVKLAAADADVLRPGVAIRLQLKSGAERAVAVEAVRPHKRILVVRLRGVTDADAVRELQGALVSIARKELPQLPDSVYRQADLVGLQVVDAQRGSLGEVRDIRRYPSCDMLVVGDKQTLVPLLRAYGAKVDRSAGTIYIRLPDGFEEI